MAKYKYEIYSADNTDPEIIYFEPITIILHEENDGLITDIAEVLDAVENGVNHMDIFQVVKTAIEDSTIVTYPPA